MHYVLGVDNNKILCLSVMYLQTCKPFDIHTAIKYDMKSHHVWPLPSSVNPRCGGPQAELRWHNVINQLSCKTKQVKSTHLKIPPAPSKTNAPCLEKSFYALSLDCTVTQRHMHGSHQLFVQPKQSSLAVSSNLLLQLWCIQYFECFYWKLGT